MSAATASACRNLVETALIRTGAFSVLSFSDVEEILKAQELAVSDCTEEPCTVQIGKLVAAERIAVGRLNGMGSKLLLTVRLVDVTTGKSIRAEAVTVTFMGALPDSGFTVAYAPAGLRYVPGSGAAVTETGELYVTAPEGKVLDVLLDGEARGRTPVLVQQVPFGVHLDVGRPHLLRHDEDLSEATQDGIADAGMVGGKADVVTRYVEGEPDGPLPCRLADPSPLARGEAMRGEVRNIQVELDLIEAAGRREFEGILARTNLRAESLGPGMNPDPVHRG